ncbi:MAG: protein phosphatase 2C domain-containing protein [Polyangiaceae bacterium]|nr:protein phosphatase 2C domain-containing protein [Polyangiaceae bacterium]
MSEESSHIPAVDIALRTDPGRSPDKRVNEDSAAYVETPFGLLAIVCDGMGGHAGGKEASELAIETISELVQAAPAMTKPRDALRAGIEEANRRVWSMPMAESGRRPGSTVVAVLFHASGAEIAHVGDSRIYLVHAGVALQITKDHSIVQEMVERNILRPEQAATHPDANKILRALGIAQDVEVDLRPEPVAYVAGDTFVLCSDGLSDLVGPADILDIAGSNPAQQAVGQLVDLANARGGYDNITALVVRMKVTAASLAAPTIAKTIPLTAIHPPAEPSKVGAYGHTPLHDITSNARQKAVPQHAAPLPRDRRARFVVLGVLLGIVAVAIVAGLVLAMHHRPSHVTVPLVDAIAPARATHDANDAHNATAAPLEDTATKAPDITPAPVLTPAGSAKSKWWTDPDANAPNGEPRACAQARWAKRTGKPPAIIATLERQCLAAGGTP